jgi:hypothetical protein
MTLTWDDKTNEMTSTIVSHRKGDKTPIGTGMTA